VSMKPWKTDGSMSAGGARSGQGPCSHSIKDRSPVSVDSTSIARPEAETSPDRGIIYLPNLPHAKRPVSVGWQFSTVMLLPHSPSSWGAIL
jgi:hypothetical protein